MAEDVGIMNVYSSPKGKLVFNTLAAVVLTALGIRFWFRKTMKKHVRTGAFAMASKDFGDGPETLRDVRALAAEKAFGRPLVAAECLHR